MWNWQIGLAKYVSHHQSWWVSSSELISAIIRVQMFHLLSHTSSCGVICEVQMFHWGLDQPEREGRRAWQFCGNFVAKLAAADSSPSNFSACHMDLSNVATWIFLSLPNRFISNQMLPHRSISNFKSKYFCPFHLGLIDCRGGNLHVTKKKLISQWIWWYSEYNRYTKYRQLAGSQRSFFSSTLKSRWLF